MGLQLSTPRWTGHLVLPASLHHGTMAVPGSCHVGTHVGHVFLSRLQDKHVDSIRDESVNFTVWSDFISNYITQQLKRSKQSRPVMIIYDNDITERSLLSFVQP